MARLSVRVQPGARRSDFAGWYGDLPKIAVAAPPVDDAANAALVTLLARRLEISERAIRIVAGRRSRTKHLEIDGFDEAALSARVIALNPRPGR